MSANRREFLKTTAAATVGLAAARPANAAPAIRRLGRPIVISDLSGFQFRNGGPENAVERAFRGITSGEDPLDALVAGVNIPELDPEETGIGYGGLPNADGVVELDASVMHGPRRWAGAVAGITGVRTPSLVAKAVAERTDHHLLAGEGARKFARDLGFPIEDDLNTPRSRELWLEWRRRVDPTHWLDPQERLRAAGGRREETDPDAIPPRRPPEELRNAMRDRADAFLAAGLSMVDDGLIPAHSFWGTINCSAVTPSGDIAGVTTTSGLAWKIPGRAGDSPIVGAGQYTDNEIGAAGSTGLGEANIMACGGFLVVEHMRQGMSPTDACLATLRRVVALTPPRLLNPQGRPTYGLNFYAINKRGETGSASFTPSNYARHDGVEARVVDSAYLYSE